MLLNADDDYIALKYNSAAASIEDDVNADVTIVFFDSSSSSSSLLSTSDNIDILEDQQNRYCHRDDVDMMMKDDKRDGPSRQHQWKMILIGRTHVRSRTHSESQRYSSISE
jgi:hypothetical protein